MGKKITWLYLSDLHFRVTEDNFNSQLIYDRLLDDLKHIEEHIYLVFVTGDIAFSGRTEEYELANKFFKSVLEILNLKKENIFFVPGNHDIQRSNTANYVSKMLESINSEKEVSEILGSKELREVFLKRLNNYYEFVENNSYLTFLWVGLGLVGAYKVSYKFLQNNVYLYSQDSTPLIQCLVALTL